MPDLNSLSRQALSAAMRGGTQGWGQHGSSTDHVRYGEPIPPRRGARRRCHCGCGNRVTHRGMANGVTLVCACELGIARWVKTGHTKPMPTRTQDDGRHRMSTIVGISAHEQAARSGMSPLVGIPAARNLEPQHPGLDNGQRSESTETP